MTAQWAGNMVSEQCIEGSGFEEASQDPTPGVIRELGELGPGAIITEAGLAKLMGRHVVSIKRAVARGELPCPTKLLGSQVWTAGAIVRHIEARLTAEADEADKLKRRLAKLDMSHCSPAPKAKRRI